MKLVPAYAPFTGKRLFRALLIGLAVGAIAYGIGVSVMDDAHGDEGPQQELYLIEPLHAQARPELIRS